MVGEAALPDWMRGVQAVGEAAFDEHHRTFECDVLRSQEQMDVVGHGHKGVELVMALATVVLERVEEQRGDCGELKDAVSAGGDAGDEVGSGSRLAFGDGHGWAKRTSAAKAAPWCGWVMARLKPCHHPFLYRNNIHAACALFETTGNAPSAPQKSARFIDQSHREQYQ